MIMSRVRFKVMLEFRRLRRLLFYFFYEVVDLVLLVELE